MSVMCHIRTYVQTVQPAPAIEIIIASDERHQCVKIQPRPIDGRR